MSRLGTGAAAVLCFLLLALGACGGHGHPTVIAVDQGLWVANSAGVDVLEFAGSTFRFRNIHDSAPHLTTASGSFVSPQDVLFDKDEDLWVVDGGDGKGDGTEGVLEFSRAEVRGLSSSPNPAPVFAITNAAGVPGFVFPQFAAFDKDGDLYVADPAINVVFLFTAAQLTSASGAGLVPTAVFQIDTSAAVLGLLFAADGRLFIADNGAAQIFELKKSHIPKSGGTAGSPTAIAADVILSSNDNPTFASIDGPWAMVFDTNGDLWFSNEGLILKSGPSVVEIAATDLASSAAPTPKLQLTAATLSNGDSSIDDPQGLSFDNLGDLVIANAANSSIAKFEPGRLQESAPIPNLFIVGATSTLNAPAGIVFGANH